MEDFEKAVEILKRENIDEASWKFLALAIQSMLWSSECHDHLIKAVAAYNRDADIFSSLIREP